jgi:allantoicase/malate synthase/CubicO group peptidase (beta-lactamase class C family)
MKYYEDFLSPSLKSHILNSARPYPGVKDLVHAGETGGLENAQSLTFLCELYEELRPALEAVLNKRVADRKFIDERTKSLAVFNRDLRIDFLSPDYKTIMGLEDADGRIVMGPKTPDYANPKPEKKIAEIPAWLAGNHVTLFGPPDNPKLSVNAMNAYHRKLKGEPDIVGELLASEDSLPKWGADDEDSKTPMREDLIAAGINLTGCLEGTIGFEKYQLANDHRSLPIKRFPGLALPSFFMFYKGEPLPLHLYDFALHFFRNWENPKALAFYVPKLENEEEARYIRLMMETAEKKIQKLHPEYKIGSIRLMIVLENPRAVFRVHEMMDELYPYFAGASLGWHDYLASTARLFKEDSNYRIPVKADPDIVIKYIKASHDLLADVVGPRGGIKVGGMYGILPTTPEISSPSFQITLKGYFRDVVTQFKRDLTGFWVAHPDFVRLGLALVSAWKFHLKGDSSKLDRLVTEILDEKYHKEILDFIHGPDIKGLEKNDPMYARKLIVADIRESNYIANNHPDEIRYNVFQSLQYITDWLSGNGCVALPTTVGGVPARVMDDLATAERSRWEVWHELYHGRFPVEDFIRIAHEEMHFIRKDLSNDKKIVQVKWDERTSKWYPVAMNLMLKLMTDKEPVEFATQLFLPFTIDDVRSATDPWKKATDVDPVKFAIRDDVKNFHYFFEMCGSQNFASAFAHSLVLDYPSMENMIRNFPEKDVLSAASFHGDIGERPKGLDAMAKAEQAKVTDSQNELLFWGNKYREKFGVKFLVSAKGKSGSELLTLLKERFENTKDAEWKNAREALWEITKKRIEERPLNLLHREISSLREERKIPGAHIALLSNGHIQSLAFGGCDKSTWFEMASLSKSVASAFAIEYFRKKNISLRTPVNTLLKDFKIPGGDKVTIEHLMSHKALNLHYVNGVPADRKMPSISQFLTGNKDYGYDPIKVVNDPGTKFQYSGGGFLVLEHLLETLEGQPVSVLTRDFLDQLGMSEWSFHQETLPEKKYAVGFSDDGKEIEGKRKMFPAFAAGAMGTAEAMAKFLSHLETAFHDPEGSGPLSHDTARLMLHGTDQGCRSFMGCLMGLGIFIAHAGDNKFMIHQGANDGFRCLFLHAFEGPDRGTGMVILANKDNEAMLFIAEATQAILKEMKLQGVDLSRFGKTFSTDKLKQEEIVNLGYKNLVFNAFLPMRPEPITDRGPLDPLAEYNLCVAAEILDVSDEMFARAENLISDHLPKFDPGLFGKQGKVMDSWETVRHNPSGVDTLHIRLKKSGDVKYALLSTKYHTGNFSPEVMIEGLSGGKWKTIIPRTKLEGHAELRITLPEPAKAVTEVRVSQFPDGGFTRLGLYSDLPETLKKTFDGVSRVYEEKVPQTKKPLAIPYEPTGKEIAENWKRLNGEFNNASLALGAKIISATDEHYSPASAMLSPTGPINMFDGMESARSRAPGHFEEVVLSLAKPLPVKRIEMDFTYFVNNNPLEVSVDAFTGKEWKEIIPRTWVKPFRGNEKHFTITHHEKIEQLRIRTFPCGGMNRFRAISDS